MAIKNLRDVFHQGLKDIYSAEKQLTEALPVLVKSAYAPELKDAFEQHLAVTRRQLDTVHKILAQMNINPGNTKCEAMEGLIAEGAEMAQMEGDRQARDAGLICAAQKVEHYEIATYGSLRTWARILGEESTATTLQALLDEEYEADNTLDKLAEGYLNRVATT